MNKLVLAAAILLAAPAARADGITLDDALRRALSENPLLARAVVDVEVTDARVLQASGLDDFVVGAAATWQRARGENVSGQATPLTPYDAVDANVSLTRPFATGGTVGVKFDAPWARLGAPTGGTFDVYQPSASIVFTHPLLRGRGFDVARA